MNGTLPSLLLGTSGLLLIGVAALFLTAARGGINPGRAKLLVPWGLLAVLAQAAHFAEELSTRFYQRFPELLGLTAWPLQFFIAFNLVWLAIWLVSIRAVSTNLAALFALWFLGLASVANGVAHPLFAARTAGYFPGLFTSPLVGVAGVLLLRRLLLATGDSPAPATSS